MSQEGQGPALDPPGRAALDRHTYSLRVYYEDTDAGGVVYHARYLGMAERARTEALRDAGAPHAELATAHGLAFVVHRLAIEYHRPARLDDLLAVETTLAAISAARLSLRQTIRRDATLLVTLAVDLACIDATGRPARIPPRWRGLGARSGSPSAGPSSSPGGLSEPSASSARTRKGPKAL